MSPLEVGGETCACRDVAVIDGRGYGQIVGRMKDMIIRGGENIYPR